jgi:signal recognition particle GTPase
LQNAIAKNRGGRRSAPYVFTEQGVAMLSSVLRSNRAADVNVVIMRTFVKIRRILATNDELAQKVAQHDRHIAVLFDNLQKLLAPPATRKNPIGYVLPKV